MQAVGTIPCRDLNGSLIGQLVITDRRQRETVYVGDDGPSISELGEYFVRMDGPTASALRFAAPVEALATGASAELIGVLSRPPGLGVVRIVLETADGTPVSRTTLSVRPEKLRDRIVFETMVSDLCRWRTELALDLHAHSSAPWVWSDAAGAMSPEERLVVLRGAIEANRLFEALATVERAALGRLERDVALVNIGREEIDAFRVGRYISAPGARSVVPTTHPLAARMASIPLHLPPARKVESLDTPENQFVKVAVRRFREALGEALRQVPYYSDSPLAAWARTTEARLARISLSSFFSHISWPAHVSLGSPTLQRREGYRSVLRTYLDLRAGFSMPWDDLGHAVFAETRDVPTIYELWCLLRIRGTLEQLFETKLDLAHFLRTSGRLSVCRGAVSNSTGPVQLEGKAYALRLYYNRTFSPLRVGSAGGFHLHGSGLGTWSKPMKPDFTIELWPAEMSQPEAAGVGLQRLVHLDAKYRLRRLIEGGDIHQPDDLDKMHAYVGSINHSVGSYALFPGDTEELYAAPTPMNAVVGAIPLAPGTSCQFATSLLRVLQRAVKA